MKDDILEVLSMKDIIDKYGFKAKNRMIICPFHNDKTASLRIYDKSFYCFGCNKTGDLIQFVEYLFNLSFRDAIKKINIDFNLGLDLDKRIDMNKIRKIQEEKYRKQIEEHTKNIAFQKKCDVLHYYHRYIKYFSKKINKDNWENYTYIMSFLLEQAQLLEDEIDSMY